jgi:hypothetical protein
MRLIGTYGKPESLGARGGQLCAKAGRCLLPPLLPPALKNPSFPVLPIFALDA